METSSSNARATKKQRELLSFIDGFVKGNGYGPSYREIMRALEYKSVSTVATHVNGLIAKGYLTKTDTSARSLTVVKQPVRHVSHEQWLAETLRSKRREHALKNDSQNRDDVEAIDRIAKIFDITL